MEVDTQRSEVRDQRSEFFKATMRVKKGGPRVAGCQIDGKERGVVRSGR